MNLNPPSETESPLKTIPSHLKKPHPRQTNTGGEGDWFRRGRGWFIWEEDFSSGGVVQVRGGGFRWSGLGFGLLQVCMCVCVGGGQTMGLGGGVCTRANGQKLGEDRLTKLFCNLRKFRFKNSVDCATNWQNFRITNMINAESFNKCR